MGEIGGRAWQRMLSGRRLDILDPSPLDIEISDIALGLSRVARWNGQTVGEHGYSVAQHSILVAELFAADQPQAPSKCILAALIHDAPEYVTSDIVTPMKRAVGESYRVIEEKVARAVHLAFGLPAKLPAEWEEAVGAADRLAAHIEAVQLAGFSELEASRIFATKRQTPEVQLMAWPAAEACRRFIEAFDELTSGRRPTRRFLTAA